MSRKEIVSAVFDNKFMRAQTLYRLKKKNIWTSYTKNS